MISEALDKAKEHDEYQQRTSNTLGPLHGIPFTLKDTYDVKNYDSSLGISALAKNPAKESSVLHETLTRLGAILLAKTNVPQALLSFECNNPVFGVTMNPWVNGYTCGGSSGGEAVVLARDASALGFGSDIGGSLRIPAGWSGIYSLKPTRGRFTSRGHNSTLLLTKLM
jgi:Asp-tRNA(Asn)/Glu-tRNA(Gln) amidotransferase A subunit family amidase